MMSEAGGPMAMTYEMTLDWLKNANVVVQVQVLEILKFDSDKSTVELSVKIIKKLNQSTVSEGDILRFSLRIWTPQSPPSGHGYFNLAEVQKNQLFEAFLVNRNSNEFKYLDGIFIQIASEHSQYIDFLKSELEKREAARPQTLGVFSRIKIFLSGKKKIK